MGKDTATLDQIRWKLTSIKSDIEEMEELVGDLETSKDLVALLEVMVSNMSSEAADITALLEAHLDVEEVEDEDGNGRE